MPRPTRDAVLKAVNYRGDWTDEATADRVMAIIDAAWAERERLDRYINHLPECYWWLPVQEGGGGCTCGLYALPDGPRVFLSGEAGAGSPGDDLEQYNRGQRLRREGYETALEELGYIAMGSPKERAAQRHPLRKRVPKVIPDPHGDGEWAINEVGLLSFAGATRAASLPITTDRIRALAALLDDPWTVEEDTSVEGGTDG